MELELDSVAENKARLDAGTMIPDLLQAAPSARQVLDRYGLRGCGGLRGPAESLEFFSHAHDVPLERLLGELRQAIDAHPGSMAEVSAPTEQLGDSIYRPFFRAGIAVVLTLGAAWGALLLVRIALLKSFTAITLHEINAHGHAQIFGWVGLFVMGFAYQALPRFKHASLAHPRWAYSTLWLMIGGLVVRSVLEPVATAWPWLGVVAVVASTVEIAAVAIFIFVVVATLRGSGKRLEAYEYYILAALGWFLVHALYEAVYLAATLRAPDHDHLLGLISTWQAPLREIQIHGFALLMILGASQRIFHYFYGLPAPNPRKSLIALIVLNAALVGNVVGFVLMRLVSHAWAGLWYGSILVMAITVVTLVTGWHIYSPARDADRSLKYLRTAYVWLFISLAMVVFLPVYQFGILSRFAPESAAASIGFSHAYYGAIRHAVTVGFVSLMIMGVSAKVAPTLAGIDVHKLNSLWLPLVLINSGCALRVTTQILTDYTATVFPISGVSGLLELTALTIWGVHLWRLMSRRVEAQSCQATPILVQISPTLSASAVTGDDLVADVLARYPELLETFVSFGFSPLKNPLMRATVARITTVRRASAALGVDLERLLAALNAVAHRAPLIQIGSRLPVETPDGTTTVRELVGQYPQTRKVFEQFGIDYCCGGGQCLADAAKESRKGLSALLVALETAVATPATAPGIAERDWYTAPLHELVAHILQVHHAYMKQALPKVNELARKVLHAHGTHHGDMLQRVYDLYRALADELSGHLMKEESILFPYIVNAEAHRNGASGRPAACFGSVESPIRQMEHEHESAGQTLAEIRKLTSDYRLPEDACPTFRALYEELVRMEGDLHQHIHLENNILFPRAIAAESPSPSGVVSLTGRAV